MKIRYLIAAASVLLSAARAFASQTPDASGHPLAQAPLTTTYIVQSGDTLSTIAQEFHTSVAVIADLNHIDNQNLINVGEQLAVPSPNIGLPQGSQAMVANLTAYTDGFASTGKVPGDPGYGITSTGQQAIQGLTVAVDPSVIPYGTPVFIPGVGLRLAEDTGGAIIGHHIDVFYNSDQTAIDFGVKRGVLVYLLPKRSVTLFDHRIPVLVSRKSWLSAQSNVGGASRETQPNINQPIGLQTGSSQASGTKADSSQPAHTQTGSASSSVTTGTLHTIALSDHQTWAKDAPLKIIQPAFIAPAIPHVDPPTQSNEQSTAAQAYTPTPSQHPTFTRRLDVLDVWDVVLDRYVWQPILEATKHHL